MNTARHRSTLLTLAGTALALSLTACQNGSGVKSSSAATPAATVASSSTTSGATVAAGTDGSGAAGSAGTARSTGSAGSTGSTGSPASAGSAGESGRQAAASTPACTARNVRVTAAGQDGPPTTHIVLTAKNTSGHSCRLPGFPHVQFLESHKQDVPAVAKSKPAAPVVLAPGAPAYALVKLSDGGVDEDNEPVSAFSVTLEGDSTVVAVAAPGSEGIAVDPAKALTGYWTPELRNGADDF
ncbi:DUF4232 domain-containing protein [Streptomyces sp. NBC_00704]|uniref:DUF4232 domain-containing protein n=1 Tax=Streptomyces sp. NBC_00704 TaxID=2975809 RepID=UPI002E351688|nr:DUF4232 domain-containing protein [Streptomyces sp. NBC_00704]